MSSASEVRILFHGEIGNASLHGIAVRRLNAKLQGSPQTFIRFGDIPESGHSYNHYLRQPEAGVSVFYGIVSGGTVIPDIRSSGQLHSITALCAQTPIKPAYIVTGSIITTGGDNEPVLRNPTITADLVPVVNDGVIFFHIRGRNVQDLL